MKTTVKNILVYNESEFGRLPKKKIIEVINKTAIGEKCKDFELKIIYVLAEEILRINNEFLKHNYETDVITFNLEEDKIDGEIYICVKIAKEQSLEYNVSLENELKRLAVHGFLHLLGYEDNTKEAKQIMSSKENEYIA